MLWIAICLPELPLEVCAAGLTPVAIVDARRVLHANRIAVSAGVSAGMKRATALALCPSLTLLARDFGKENAALRALALWALAFTPNVTLTPPSDDAPAGVLLEISASLKLFGGKARILAAVRKGLAAQGFGARIATAPAPQAAWILARAQDAAEIARPADLQAVLSPLPAWLLGPGKPHWDQLQGIGVSTIGDLLRLPRAGVARRFSPALLDELDRALGKKADPRDWFPAPATFTAQLELAARVDNAEALLFAARRLMVQLSGWLASRHAATRTLNFNLIHDHRAPTPLTLTLADASNDEERFTALLREVLGKTRLAAPVYELRLACDNVVDVKASSNELFATARTGHATAQEGVLRLVERLQARLGAENIVRLELHADHRPERAFRTVALAADSESARSARQRAGAANTPKNLAPRPLWLLPEPIALNEKNHAIVYQTPLKLIAGPERIEGGWWDDQWAERDYFIAEDTEHAWLWIFRPRMLDPNAPQGWYLHGKFG